jgi:hypothetical protein
MRITSEVDCVLPADPEAPSRAWQYLKPALAHWANC